MPNNDRPDLRDSASGAVVELRYSRSGDRDPSGNRMESEAGIPHANENASTPVVLLHGYCGSRRYWDAVVPLLSAEYDVIVPDLRGHGESPAPELPAYTMEQLA